MWYLLSNILALLRANVVLVNVFNMHDEFKYPSLRRPFKSSFQALLSAYMGSLYSPGKGALGSFLPGAGSGVGESDSSYIEETEDDIGDVEEQGWDDFEVNDSENDTYNAVDDDSYDINGDQSEKEQELEEEDTINLDADDNEHIPEEQQYEEFELSDDAEMLEDLTSSSDSNEREQSAYTSSYRGTGSLSEKVASRLDEAAQSFIRDLQTDAEASQKDKDN
jgi:hypothetical protein